MVELVINVKVQEMCARTVNCEQIWGNSTFLRQHLNPITWSTSHLFTWKYSWTHLKTCKRGLTWKHRFVTSFGENVNHLQFTVILVSQEHFCLHYICLQLVVTSELVTFSCEKANLIRKRLCSCATVFTVTFRIAWKYSLHVEKCDYFFFLFSTWKGSNVWKYPGPWQHSRLWRYWKGTFLFVCEENTKTCFSPGLKFDFPR